MVWPRWKDSAIIVWSGCINFTRSDKAKIILPWLSDARIMLLWPGQIARTLSYCSDQAVSNLPCMFYQAERTLSWHSDHFCKVLAKMSWSGCKYTAMCGLSGLNIFLHDSLISLKGFIYDDLSRFQNFIHDDLIALQGFFHDFLTRLESFFNDDLTRLQGNLVWSFVQAGKNLPVGSNQFAEYLTW